jgi:hypothetical protein
LNYQKFRIDFFENIFEENGKKYSEPALLYQDILLLLLNKNDQLVNSWKINEELETIHEFKYKDPKNKDKPFYDKMRNRQGRINNCFKELKNYNFLISKPVTGKGGINTNGYQLTKFGYITALIIKTEKYGTNKEFYEELFRLLKSYFKDQPSSFDRFCLIFFPKCIEENVFNEYFEYFKEKFLFGIDIPSEKDLYIRMILLVPKKEKLKLFQIWKNSFDILSEPHASIFKHNIKNIFETIMQEKSKSIAQYEYYRYNVRHKEYELLLETECSLCGIHCYSLIPFNLFIQSCFNSQDFSKIISNYITSTCKNRNKHQVTFPFEMEL